MKTVQVASRSGKKIPITMLTNWDLIFCVPIFLLSLIAFFVLKPITDRLVFALSGIVEILFGMASRDTLNKQKVQFPILISMATLPLFYLLHHYFPEMGYLSVSLIFIAQTILSVRAIQLLLFFHNQYFVPREIKTELDRYMSKEFARIPDYLLSSNLSKSVCFSGSIIAIYCVYHLVFLLLLASMSWFYWMLLIPVFAILFFSNIEMSEHIASHSRQGRIINKQKASTLYDHILVNVDRLLRYIVWPASFWFPDAYYCTHSGIHHIENNGPADFQSTLRFDQSSFISFMKANTWFSLFNVVIPLDSFRYLHSMGRKNMFSTFLRGYLLGLAMFAFITYLFPVIGLAVFWVVITQGSEAFLAILRWHGFHNREVLYSVEASNNSPLHYGHHWKPGVHLHRSTDMLKDFWLRQKEGSSGIPIFKSPDAQTYYTEHWLFICSLFWQGKLDVVHKLVDVDSASKDDLAKYIVGLQFTEQSESTKKLDRDISRWVGSKFENYYRRKNKDLEIPDFSKAEGVY